MTGTTNRARVRATTGAAGRDRSLPRPPILRAPIASLVFSLLTFAAPALAVAPLLATEPVAAPTELRGGLVPERRLPADAPAAVPLDGGILAGDARARSADALRFQAALDAARERAKAFGVTLAVIRDGDLAWVGSSGTTRDDRPLTPGEPMVIGSITKTFVAAAVLQLVAEGQLDLDGSARDYLPAGVRVDPRITVRQLLDHTSGLADVFNDDTRTGIETDVGHAWTADEVLGTVRDAWYDPGEGWAYSNTNYLLLAMIVEEVTGSSLADVVAGRFTEPLGLRSTAVLSGADGEALAPAWATIFHGSGAMTSTAADLARWGTALYDGDVLSPRLRRDMLRMNADDYGLGAQRIELGGAEGVGHTGLLNTTTALLLHVPSQDVTIAMLVNRTQVDLDLMLRAHPSPDEPSLLEVAIGR